MKTAHAEIVEELNKRWPEDKIGPSLARISALMGLLGEPQESAPVIQITGTNGKGSTAIMIDALLRAQGLRTGRYVSPHLIDPRERINVDGQPISEEDFDRVWTDIEPYVRMVDAQLIDGIAMTGFEVLTAMAYAAFADAPVDVQVVEVGMGGSWDATTVADADVAVFTPISLDHMEYLGDDVEQIAAEKAGIIKANSHVVIAGQEPAAAKAILHRCAELGVPVSREGVDFTLLDRQLAVGGQVIRLESATGPVGDVYLPAYGAAMAANAVLAVGAVEALDGMRGLDPKVIEDGFGQVRVPARTERVHVAPPIVIDTCHNPAAVASTLDSVDEAFAFAPQIAVWGMMADKQIEAVLRLVEPRVSSIVVTQAVTSRAMPAVELGRMATDIFGANRVIVRSDLAAAIDEAVRLADDAGAGAGILLAGSVALAGQARALLEPTMSQADE
ncbi:MAG: bifunctional folylpolyglutamate synthase/dihydrofolate synthase [Propionibacteriaceae bacterium]|jgi:dihydrofolate synthase/folylpolyglutamate synthase|nr:bifunctional folylpolyglutamate synthase/dihydrofolate synthase [Propionibacteriaceae bacterium]